MHDLYTDIAKIMAADPGGRGLAGKLPAADLPALTRSLLGGSRFLVITGFPIPDCGAGETDGPPGAANLARVLTRAGGRVTVVTDAYSFAPVRAAVRLYAPGVRVLAVPMRGAAGFCARLLRRENPTHVLALERPGSHSGHYHSMKATLLDAYVAPTDSLFTGFGGVTVGIGDGGNELGMGGFAAEVAKLVPNGADIAADVGADFALIAGVSNWWGWGIAALLSGALGQNLLPDPDEEADLLIETLRAGAVDGMAHRQQLTVDELTLEENLAILRRLRRAVRRALGDGCERSERHASAEHEQRREL